MKRVLSTFKNARVGQALPGSAVKVYSAPSDILLDYGGVEKGDKEGTMGEGKERGGCTSIFLPSPAHMIEDWQLTTARDTLRLSYTYFKAPELSQLKSSSRMFCS